MTRIAVIGGGRIGEALVAGLLEAGTPGKDLVVVEPMRVRAEFLVDRFGIRVTDSVVDAANMADLLVVAVKPHDVDAVLTDLAKAELDGDRDQLLVSLAAGITTARLEAKLPAGFPVVRVMPNSPMLVGQGMSAIAAGRYAKEAELRLVTELLESVGRVVTVSEAQMDAVTAVSGSGPAYLFLLAEAMVDAGVGLGLSRDVTTQLVVQTLLGSAALLAESGQGPVELRAGVTSPGGTTAAALRELERGGVRSAFWEALFAARQRSAELGATES
ncbi:pyrroline-5-carboxylate reductase [Nocardia sp. alder85J]|uniref:pyrroline-5-carboxylate reductase n=1 Tax=Nocardia sp. alder85J TaxID=2862949 RepID=UPI001CD3C250|nr:pyrroline-5-carboxylate reductase [Nocardia sp. alder85J]MCX4098789.1 pyrroline-5-carboxylate reductase [Nocardia sp. alder85J]